MVKSLLGLDLRDDFNVGTLRAQNFADVIDTLACPESQRRAGRISVSPQGKPDRANEAAMKSTP